MIAFITCALVICSGGGFVAGCMFASGIAFDNGYRAGRRSAVAQSRGFSVVDR